MPLFTMRLFLSILITTLYLLSVYAFPSDCARPRCKKCLPVEIHDAPGVGFDLTPSYG